MYSENVVIIERLFKKEQEELVNTAKEISDMFWKHRENMLEVRSGGATPILGCRVADKDGSLRITWFYWSFYHRNGVNKRTNVHITKSKGKYQYSMTKLFKKALPNEIEAIEFCEQRFAQLRQQSDALRKMKHSFHYYKKAKFGDAFDEIEEMNKEAETQPKEFGS